MNDLPVSMPRPAHWPVKVVVKVDFDWPDDELLAALNAVSDLTRGKK